MSIFSAFIEFFIATAIGAATFWGSIRWIDNNNKDERLLWFILVILSGSFFLYDFYSNQPSSDPVTFLEQNSNPSFWNSDWWKNFLQSHSFIKSFVSFPGGIGALIGGTGFWIKSKFL